MPVCLSVCLSVYTHIPTFLSSGMNVCMFANVCKYAHMHCIHSMFAGMDECVYWAKTNSEKVELHQWRMFRISLQPHELFQGTVCVCTCVFVCVCACDYVIQYIKESLRPQHIFQGTVLYWCIYELFAFVLAYVCVCVHVYVKKHKSGHSKSLRPRKHLKEYIDLHINSCIHIHMHTRTHTHTHTHTFTHTHTYTHIMYTGKYYIAHIPACVYACVGGCVNVCVRVDVCFFTDQQWLYSFFESDNIAIIINGQLLFFAAACKMLFTSYIWISHVLDMAHL